LFSCQFVVTSTAISFFIEKYLAPFKACPRLVVFVLILMNLTHILVFPAYCGIKYEFHPIVRGIYTGYACVWFFKFSSYHHVWHDLRNLIPKIQRTIKKKQSNEDIINMTMNGTTSAEKSISEETPKKILKLTDDLKKDVMAYPSNVSAWNTFIFTFLPTMVFQVRYPFARRNIKGFFMGVAKLSVLFYVYIIIMLAFFNPKMQEFMRNFDMNNWVTVLVLYIDVCLATMLAFWITFYAMFHIYLNAFADLTGFTDRRFYGDWWNSSSFSEYWQKWNRPTHDYLKRHVYFFALSKGFSKTWSMIIVFIVSGVFHEYIFAVCLGKISGQGFNAMVFYIPLILICDGYFRIGSGKNR